MLPTAICPLNSALQRTLSLYANYMFRHYQRRSRLHLRSYRWHWCPHPPTTSVSVAHSQLESDQIPTSALETLLVDTGSLNTCIGAGKPYQPTSSSSAPLSDSLMPPRACSASPRHCCARRRPSAALFIIGGTRFEFTANTQIWPLTEYLHCRQCEQHLPGC